MKLLLSLILGFVLSCLTLLRAEEFDQPPAKLVIATWNVEWMFDDFVGNNRSELSREQSAPSAAYWNAKVDAVATAIATLQPSILALQEIEGDETLVAISSRLREKHNLNYRFAFIQGSDRTTEQDVGLLFRGGLTQYRRHEQTKVMFDSQQYYNLSKHLVGEFQWAQVTSPLTMMNVHFRATEEGADFRARQARLARHWLEQIIKRGEDVVMLGDINSEHSVGDNSSEIKILCGEAPNQLIDLLQFAPPDKRRTHLILDRQFDRILVSRSMMEDGAGKDWVFEKMEVRSDVNVRGKVDGPEHWEQRLTSNFDELDTSDHFPVVATFELK